MNKREYSFGNLLKVEFRNHYCYKCGCDLTIIKHRKVVNQKSDEAKYYDFSVGSDGIMVGPCEFIHKVFYCPKCLENIEFVTQINLEDIDIILNKVVAYFDKKGKSISIKKYFENQDGFEEDKIKELDKIKNLCLVIEDKNKSIIYKLSISRKKVWERPYYFKISKKELIKFIKLNFEK